MPKANNNGKNKDSAVSKPQISRLGQRLRAIREKALASGTETLSTAEIHRLISEIRGRSA
jgi:hypothetical protein